MEGSTTVLILSSTQWLPRLTLTHSYSFSDSHFKQSCGVSRQSLLTVPLVAELTLRCRVSAGLVFSGTACNFCCVNAPCPVDRMALRLECVSEPFCYQGEYYHTRSRGQLCRSYLFFSHSCFCIGREEPTPRIQQHSGSERKQQYQHGRMRYRICKMGWCFSCCGESDVGEHCKTGSLSDYQTGVHKFQTRDNMRRGGRSGVRNIVNMKWTSVPIVKLKGSETPCQSRAQGSQLRARLGGLGLKRDCKVICRGWTRLLFRSRCFD